MRREGPYGFYDPEWRDRVVALAQKLDQRRVVLPSADSTKRPARKGGEPLSPTRIRHTRNLEVIAEELGSSEFRN